METTGEKIQAAIVEARREAARQQQRARDILQAWTAQDWEWLRAEGIISVREYHEMTTPRD